jgi:hypothetical protein
MASGLPPSELIDLYQTSRQIIWRYNLDKMEVSALRTAMRSAEKAVEQILSNPTKRLKRWEQLRRQDLIREIDSLTLGIREQVAGEISSLAGQAGAESAKYHSQTMSLGGRVQGFNNVALSPEQFRSFFQTTPLGGATLNQWVNRAFDATVRQGILEDLNAGVLQGKGYPGLVDNIMGHMEGFTRKEAVTLARTFVQQANVSAQQAVMAANSDIVTGWRWSSVLENSNLQTGTGTCLRCASLDNSSYNLGEGPPIPLHPNCLTAETPVFAPDKIAAFVATYEGIVFELVLANGARFTVTPKHMLLTGEGFSPADSIRKGDKVFYNPVADGVIFGCPDNNRDDSSIANVVKSFSKNPGVVSTSVPASSEHLHGDGEFIKGNVEIITFESLLRGDLESFRTEFLNQFELSLANVDGLGLECLGGLLSPLFWLRLASNRLVCGQSVSDVFSTAALRHHEAVGIGAAASFNSILEQKPGYDVSGNIKFFGDGIFGDTGNVKGNDVFERELIASAISRLGLDVKGLNTGFFDSLQNSIWVNPKLFGDFTRVYAGHILPTNVVSIKRRKFSGHVYDLQCLSGMYHVDGALSSNCRCVPIPELVSYRELGVDVDELEEVARPWTERPDIPIGEGGRDILTWGTHKGEYASWFESRGAKFQKNVVGPKRYALIQAGKVKFKDLVDPNTGRLYRLDELGG